jgi:hypothetical protein
MLKIRAEQNSEFADQARQSFVERALRHAREELPGPVSCLSDDELRQSVRRATGRAGVYGLTTERQIICFLDASLLLGEGFEEQRQHEALRRLLLLDGIPPDRKAATLLAAALLRSDPRAPGG